MDCPVVYEDVKRDTYQPGMENAEYETSVLNAECSLKGFNPFGEVVDGFIRLEGPLFRQFLAASQPTEGKNYFCCICHLDLESENSASQSQSWNPTCIDLDVMLGEVSRQGRSTTLQRLRIVEPFRPFRAAVDCLALCHEPGKYHAALILGEPVTPGVYERLGILQWYGGGAIYSRRDLEAIERCYRRAETRVVTIV